MPSHSTAFFCRRDFLSCRGGHPLAGAPPSPSPWAIPPPVLLRRGALAGRVDFALFFAPAAVFTLAIPAVSVWFQFQGRSSEARAVSAVSGTAEKGGGATAAILVPSAEERAAAVCIFLCFGAAAVASSQTRKW